ncbi:hypothetical protein PG985_003704 [Apiospora marii]|uniref:Heterokaryon incompatibility domain-containing protein n=1 Tax=Apiospora marii TaxID=335849 RepID=A0ABR1SHD8_9PEZI
MSPEILTPLVYTGLKPGQIRLLYPDTRADRDDCWSLKETNLLDYSGKRTSLEFDALSYTWGEDQVTTFAVHCNDQELRVHHNLHEALPFLARRDSQLPIWIDAVCINQGDEDEKKVQIAMMRQIFEGASTVWVWLGRGNARSGDVIAMLPQKEGKRVYGWVEMKRMLETEIADKGREVIPWLSSNEAWSTYYDLSENPWYRRLWVFQEVALAKRIRVLLGPHEVDWEKLENVCVNGVGANFVGGDGRKARAPKPLVAGVFQVRRERWEALASGNFTARNFCNVLLQTSGTACREPADRVWALTGFMNLEVPNGASIIDMYVQLARSVLVRLQPTFSEWWKFLHSATSLSKRPDLPSWCPDFHDVEGQRSLPTHISKEKSFMGSAEIPFKASRRNSKPKAPQDMHSRRLVLCGQIFDRIEETYPPFQESGKSKDDDFIPCFHTWEESIASAVFQRATGDEKSGKVQITTNDYWTTLRGGYTKDSGASPMSLEVLTVAKAQLQSVMGVLKPDFARSSLLRLRDISTLSPEIKEYMRLAFEITLIQDGRCCFSTAQGRFGSGPSNIAVGDSICIFSFAATAHIIRRTPDSNSETYTLVGEAYVHGMMHGEVEHLGIEEQEIVLA